MFKSNSSKKSKEKKPKVDKEKTEKKPKENKQMKPKSSTKENRKNNVLLTSAIPETGNLIISRSSEGIYPYSMVIFFN